MVDIAVLLTLQGRARRNALQAARVLRRERELAKAVQRAVDATTGGSPYVGPRLDESTGRWSAPSVTELP